MGFIRINIIIELLQFKLELKKIIQTQFETVTVSLGIISHKQFFFLRINNLNSKWSITPDYVMIHDIMASYS